MHALQRRRMLELWLEQAAHAGKRRQWRHCTFPCKATCNIYAQPCTAPHSRARCKLQQGVALTHHMQLQTRGPNRRACSRHPPPPAHHDIAMPAAAAAAAAAADGAAAARCHKRSRNVVLCRGLSLLSEAPVRTHTHTTKQTDDERRKDHVSHVKTSSIIHPHRVCGNATEGGSTVCTSNGDMCTQVRCDMCTHVRPTV